jgi:uncharacterized protein (UPF0297 family)
MQVFIRRPNIELLSGIRVSKDTEIEFENENVKQTIKDLVLRSVSTIKGEGYESTNNTTIYLSEGDVLIFEEEGRGYIKPLEAFVTIAEAIDDLTNIKDLG